jgi:LAO/AO transport system kinase
VTAAAEVAAALARDKRTVARLVTAFEDPRPAACTRRQALVAALDAAGAPHGRVIGITGTPGAGKSSLVGALALALADGGPGVPGLTVAVVAVDPSSPVSGGALLGDRTRVRFPIGDARLYFRSQPSGGEVGGLARATFQACRLLTRLFDLVVLETVGIGQSEIEIVRLADMTFLVMQPHGGDHVQFMKGGIMEVPDVFVVNKVDLPGANATVHALRASLRLGGPGRADRPVLKTSARSGLGVDELATAVRGAPGPHLAERELAFFRRWVEGEYGRWGNEKLAKLAPDLAGYLAANGGLDGAQLAFAGALG